MNLPLQLVHFTEWFGAGIERFRGLSGNVAFYLESEYLILCTNRLLEASAQLRHQCALHGMAGVAPRSAQRWIGSPLPDASPHRHAHVSLGANLERYCRVVCTVACPNCAAVYVFDILRRTPTEQVYKDVRAQFVCLFDVCNIRADSGEILEPAVRL